MMYWREAKRGPPGIPCEAMSIRNTNMGIFDNDKVKSWLGKKVSLPADPVLMGTGPIDYSVQTASYVLPRGVMDNPTPGRHAARFRPGSVPQAPAVNAPAEDFNPELVTRT